MTYASKTSVSCSRTRSEIEDLLNRHGATGFFFLTDQDSRMERVEFKMPMHGNVLVVRLEVPVPEREKFRYGTGRLKYQRRTDEALQVHFEQACRSAWRALLLILKAKLVAVEAGARSFEQEFLYDIVLANGRTMGEHVVPQLPAIASGKILMLPRNAGEADQATA